MALGTPVALGTKAGTSIASTQAMTVTASATVGSLLVVVMSAQTALINSFSFSSVTDSAGNTYTIDTQATSTTNGVGSIGIASTVVTSALTLNVSTITVTYAQATSKNAGIAAWTVSGAAASSPSDAKVSTTTASTAPASSGATASTAQADEIAFGAVSMGSSRSAIPGGSYTEICDFLSGVNGLEAAYLILAATGAQTYTATVSGASTSGIGVSTYKAAVVAKLLSRRARQACSPAPMAAGGSYT